MVAGGGAGEQVIAQAQLVQVLHDDLVVPVHQFPRGHTLVFRLHGDGRAVLVGAADHEDVVSGQAVIAGEDVAGNAEAGHMADVAGTVGIGPGHVD